MMVLELFFKLLIGHALADFVLQPAPMARGKNRHNRLTEEYGANFPPWYYWLSAHALTHAGMVYLVSGSLLYALIETASHALTDFLKCERLFNLHVDQFIHVSFKVLYCVLYRFSID